MNELHIIDFHTHAFPDFLAPRAMAKLADPAAGSIPFHDGTLRGLMSSMDKAGISTAVIANIATAPHQVRPILQWSRTIQSERVIPFISMHPEYTENEAVLDEAMEAGIKGVKIHNLYQGFDIDDPRMIPVYEMIAERGMIQLFHAGKDPAYENCEGASPVRIRRVHERVPNLKIVAGHYGGWRMWDVVLEELAGLDLFIEISMSLGDITEELWWAIFHKHPKEKLIFGSDSPWSDQTEYLRLFMGLPMSDDVRKKILLENARALLGL